jgi:hypothetical protein
MTAGRVIVCVVSGRICLSGPFVCLLIFEPVPCLILYTKKHYYGREPGACVPKFRVV